MAGMVLSQHTRLEYRFLASPLQLQQRWSTATGIVRKKRGCKEACRATCTLAHLPILLYL